MEATIDSAGRVLIPKALRIGLGLLPGSTVDIAAYGNGAQITPGGRVATLRRQANGRLVIDGDFPVDDDIMFGLIDAGRR